jgi:long-subunit acyl-CoA synthetase (AMP-forming)
MVDAQSLVHQLATWAKEIPDTPAIHGKVDGKWSSMTWSQYWAAAREVAKGLIALGHQPGECVAVVGHNRMEWVICQLGIMAAKGIPAPGYPTNTVEQVAHILQNSRARIAIADTKRLVDQYRAAMKLAPDDIRVEHLVAMLDGEDDEAMALSALRETGRAESDDELDARLATLGEDDTCLLIYTSGTTGVAKGVMLDHGNLMWMQGAASAHVPMFNDRVANPYIIVSYLPLCHIAEQIMTNAMALRTGGEVYFCPDLTQVKDYLVEARPTVFAAVPRVWEKFQAALEVKLGEASGIKGALASWARKTEHEAVTRDLARGTRHNSFGRGVANSLVLSKIRAALGLDRLLFASTAAAPISRATLEFFASIGIVVHEFYGMSETTGLITGNPIGRAKFGTVGVALEGAELRIADDDEILARGRFVTKGYLHMPEQTAELLDEDGWLHTGDLGAIDSGGYLKITGRKKDILITAGGKNVAPAEMEGHITQIPGVAQAVVVGDRQPFLTALVVLDAENLDTLAAAAGVERASLETLASDPKVKAHLTARVEADCNAKVARYQTIKQITVLSVPFTVDTGELTPTMKLKRNVVTVKYAAQIDAMYADANEKAGKGAARAPSP